MGAAAGVAPRPGGKVTPAPRGSFPAKADAARGLAPHPHVEARGRRESGSRTRPPRPAREVPAPDPTACLQPLPLSEDSLGNPPRPGTLRPPQRGPRTVTTLRPSCGASPDGGVGTRRPHPTPGARRGCACVSARTRARAWRASGRKAPRPRRRTGAGARARVGVSRGAPRAGPRAARARARRGAGAASAQAQARGRGGGWGGFFRKVREASGKGAARWAGPPLYKGGAGAARQLPRRSGSVPSRSLCRT